MSKDKSPPSDGLIPKLAATIVAALGPLCRRLSLPTITPSPSLRLSSPSMATAPNSPETREPQQIPGSPQPARSGRRRRGGFPAGKRRRLVDEEIAYPDLLNPDHQVLRPYLFASASEPGSSSHPPASTAADPQIVPDEEMPEQPHHPGSSKSPLRLTPSAPPPCATGEVSPSRHIPSPVADSSDSDVTIPGFGFGDEDASEVPLVPFADRAAAHRSLVADRDHADPDFRRSSTKPHNPIYISAQAVKRYKHISKRQFITQKNFPLVPGNPNREVVQFFLESTGMTPTVLDMEPYVQEIVKEFYANLAEFESREDDLQFVYVRGHMFEFSPALINKLYLIDSSRFDVTKPVIQSAASEDDLAVLMSGAKVTRWADLITKRFSCSMKMFHKICCDNWIPGTNRTTLRVDRLRLIDMVMDNKPFNFGKLVFEHALHLSKLGPNSTHRLAYPNLIYQLEASEVLDEAPPAPTSRTLLRDDLADLLAVGERMKRRLEGGEYGNFDEAVAGAGDPAGDPSDEEASG
ncbi:unnamed protein product [Arabidopsis arenosa]|uniref:Putative plant transposon protein domain-containing protein n=1 Tax=Arabidopsis arenosa TaxID=38785 RepID=A0A8S1ZIG0_ARAAE|nr:unnamed protein product [Arabidopsis arenosa]